MSSKVKKKWTPPDIDGWLLIFGLSVSYSFLVLVFSYFETMEVLRIVMVINILCSVSTCIYYLQSNRMLSRMLQQLTGLQQMMLSGQSQVETPQEEVVPSKQGHHMM